MSTGFEADKSEASALHDPDPVRALILRKLSRTPANDEMKRIATQRILPVLSSLYSEYPDLFHKAFEEMQAWGFSSIKHGLRFEIRQERPFFVILGICRFPESPAFQGIVAKVPLQGTDSP